MSGVDRRTVMSAGLAAPWLAHAGGAQAAQTDDAVRAVLRQRIDEQKRAVGIAVGIVSPQGDRTVAYGVCAAGGPPADGDTVYRIASLTKLFTALLLADMVRRGEVGLEDPVQRHLPEFRIPVGARAITLADLATHTSGLPFEGTGLLSVRGYTGEEVQAFLAVHKLEAEPGTRWLYSNLGFALLGHALAHRAGTTYDALLSARITGPLRMPSTALIPTAAMRARLAAPHDGELKPAAPALRRGGFSGPAGLLHSSVRDLNALVGVLVGKGPADLLEAARIMGRTRRPAPPIRVEQALGFQVRGQGAQAFVSGEGVTFGYNAAMACDPATGEGYVMLNNCEVAAPDIPRHLLRPAVYRLARVYRTVSLPPAALDRYVGDYRRGQGGVIEVRRRGGDLFVAIPGLPQMPVSALGADEFVQSQVAVEFQFRVDAGRTTALIVRAPGQGDAVAERISP